jgi:hypothetical protein
MGEASRVHPRVSSPWDGRLAYSSELLQWADSDSPCHIDAAAGGAFFSLTIDRAKTLIEKMVSDQGWNDERLQLRQRGMHTVKETDMLAAKLDLFLKKIEEHPQDNAPMQALQAIDARMTCEVCGTTEHSGNKCPETHEDIMYMNNNNNNN